MPRSTATAHHDPQTNHHTRRARHTIRRAMNRANHIHPHALPSNQMHAAGPTRKTTNTRATHPTLNPSGSRIRRASTHHHNCCPRSPLFKVVLVSRASSLMSKSPNIEEGGAGMKVVTPSCMGQPMRRFDFNVHVRSPTGCVASNRKASTDEMSDDRRC